MAGRRVAVLGAIVLVALVLWAPPAGAHAVLVASEPAPAAALEESPSEIVLRFDEAVTLPGGAAVRVIDERRRDVEVAEVRSSGPVVTAALPSLGDGAYVVVWRVVSADSHPVSGGFLFTVGEGTPDPAILVDALAEARSDRAVEVVLGATRAAGYVAVAALIGATVVLGLWWPAGLQAPGGRRLVQGAWVGALVLSASGTALVGLHAAGEGLGGLVRPSEWWSGLEGRYGWAWVARTSLVAAAGLVVWRPAPRRWWWWSALTAGGVGIASTVALSGHAATGSGAVAGVAVATGHVLAVAVWIGGLVAVLATLRWAPPEVRRRLVGAWSGLAAAAVAVLAGTGALQAGRELGRLEELWTTGYGRLISAKVGVALVVVGVAAGARRLVRQQVGGRPLGRRVALELAGLAVAAGLTAALAQSAPPLGRPGFLAERVVVDEVAVDVVLEPAAAGPTELHLYASPLGSLAVARDATAHLSMEGEGTPVVVPLVPAGPNHYVSDGLVLPFGGTWTLEVVLDFGAFDIVRARFELRVGGN